MKKEEEFEVIDPEPEKKANAAVFEHQSSQFISKPTQSLVQK